MAAASISNEIYGVNLPPGVPGGWIWISSNGRYITADGLYSTMPMHLDTATGEVSVMPGTPIAKPLTNYPTNDGSAILSGYWQVDGDGKWEFRPGYWFWKPGLDPVSIFSETDAQSLVISPTGRRFVFKRVCANGNIVWAVTSTNRLLRLDLSSGSAEEILPPMGSPLGAGSFELRLSGVPGSAMFIGGSGFTSAQIVVDGNGHELVSAATPTGLRIQLPSEYSSSPLKSQRLLVRSPTSPFELVLDVQIVK
jgi:hypothetical protein